jgi:uncharacterized protein involved in exopolysaccharide biosynthesis
LGTVMQVIEAETKAVKEEMAELKAKAKKLEGQLEKVERQLEAGKDEKGEPLSPQSISDLKSEKIALNQRLAGLDQRLAPLNQQLVELQRKENLLLQRTSGLFAARLRCSY